MVYKAAKNMHFFKSSLFNKQGWENYMFKNPWATKAKFGKQDYIKLNVLQIERNESKEKTG